MASETSAIRVQAAEKKLQILQLRREQHTFKEIAATIGCAPSYAHRIVKKHLVEVNALRVNEVDLMVTEMQLDLQQLVQDHWPMRLQVEHGALIAKFLAQLAKLRGLNAADKIEISNTLPATLEYVVDVEHTTRTPDAEPSEDTPAS